MYFAVGEDSFRISLAGLPIAMLLSGMSKFTKAPGAIRQLSPIATPPMMMELAPMKTLLPIVGTPAIPNQTALSYVEIVADSGPRVHHDGSEVGYLHTFADICSYRDLDSGPELCKMEKRIVYEFSEDSSAGRGFAEIIGETVSRREQPVAQPYT